MVRTVASRVPLQGSGEDGGEALREAGVEMRRGRLSLCTQRVA